MCCLEYENDYYNEAYCKMPKIGSEVMTPDGRGTVLSNSLLKLITRVKIEFSDGTFDCREYHLKDIKAQHTMAEDMDDGTAADEQIKELLD
jgi:cell fate regulator YaaT (PSP1 superfamily)